MIKQLKGEIKMMKNTRYGSSIIPIHRKQVVDMDAETVKKSPRVSSVTTASNVDKAAMYQEGARGGGPQAEQRRLICPAIQSHTVQPSFKSTVTTVSLLVTFTDSLQDTKAGS